MKYYIIAGEASGDLHASNLVASIKKQDKEAKFRGWGGDKMANQGVHLVKHINDLAFMGIVDVLANLSTIFSNLKLCRKDITGFNPDVVIFVDYPGFNLRIARFCRKAGFKAVYYISPTVWAWHKSRLKAIKRDIDRMLVILPFEKEFYSQNGFNAYFVGHPLLDVENIGLEVNTVFQDQFRSKNDLDSRKIIALLPGSRKQEITKILGEMAKVISQFPGYQFVIAGVNSFEIGFYQQYLKGEEAKIIYGQTYGLLKNAEAALVTSGTATLETAIIGTPQVVCYKTQILTYLIGRALVNIKFISLVNLIMNRKIVEELLQNDLNSKNLTENLKKILDDNAARSQMLEGYKLMREKLGGKGASQRAADIIFEFLHPKSSLKSF